MGIQSEKELWMQKRFSDYAGTLSSIIRVVIGEGDAIKIDQVFKRNETKVKARLVLQNRLDVVETLLRYHHLAFGDKHYYEWCRRTDGEQGEHLIDLMCCAVSSCDYEMVRLFLLDPRKNADLDMEMLTCSILIADLLDPRTNADLLDIEC